MIKGAALSMNAKEFIRFISRLRIDGECLVDTACLQSMGYGQFFYRNKTIGTHRISYMFFKGPIPEGMVIDHICRNRACANPDHLRVTTQQENILAGIGATAKNAKKTHCKNGHEFRPETIKRTKGGKRCAICDKEYMAVWRVKNQLHVRKYRLNRYITLGT